MSPSAGPLEGHRVLDLTQGDGAPFCAMQLGDAGGDVIKVEPLEGDWARPHGPPFDNGDGPLFMGMNRNKRSIALNFALAEARDVLKRMVSRCDVLVENFGDDTEAAALGLGYEALSVTDPGLVYCSLSVVERAGPDSGLPGTDLTAQGRAGLPRFVGQRGGEPLRFGTNYAGVTASMYATQAVLAALFERKRSGLGQRVSTSYLRALIATQQNYFTASSDPDAYTGFAVSHLGQPSHGWRTADGGVDFALGRLRDPESIARFLRAFSVEDASLGADGLALTAEDLVGARPAIEKAVSLRSTREVLATLESFNIMCAPLHNYNTMFHDEGVLEQDVIEEVPHKVRGIVRTSGLPWKLTQTPGSVRIAPPLLGEHTREILAELGYSQGDISTLEADGVVLQSS